MSNFFPLLFVIHETNTDIETSLRLHNDPEYYGSYHAIIERTGVIHYLTPADSKAFAAAKSSYFNVITGEVEEMEGSVDDFAYHVSLETPQDGIKFNYDSHTGYTVQQYQSLAWLVRASGVQIHRIVTHGELKDPASIEPRCFNRGELQRRIESLTNNKSIDFGVLDLTNG